MTSHTRRTLLFLAEVAVVLLLAAASYLVFSFAFSFLMGK